MKRLHPEKRFLTMVPRCLVLLIEEFVSKAAAGGVLRNSDFSNGLAERVVNPEY